MGKIDYKWDFDSQGANNDLPTRKNLQIARRLFHLANGVTVATLYWLSFTHAQAIHILGTIACLLYIAEQIRINYPEKAQKFVPITKFIMRAEEQLKESAMVPYAFAVLLTIITFPKPLALIAIYTLAISDPLSAIIGIKYGKRRVVQHKSIEGSLAFFTSCFIICFIVLGASLSIPTFTLLLISIIISLAASLCEMLPIRIDDNLTIPLFTASFAWIIVLFFGISI